MGGWVHLEKSPDRTFVFLNIATTCSSGNASAPLGWCMDVEPLMKSDLKVLVLRFAILFLWIVDLDRLGRKNEENCAPLSLSLSLYEKGKHSL